MSEKKPENHQYMLVLSFLLAISPVICGKGTLESTEPFSPYLRKQPRHIIFFQCLSVLIARTLCLIPLP